MIASCEADAIELQVNDDGEGIAPERVERLSDLFHQAENDGWASKRGLGVGLSLVKSLVELHGGSVRAESPGPGKGSRFTIRLPRHTANRGADTDKNRKPSPPFGHRRRVLVVDDNQDVATSTAMLLRTYGYEVEVAHSGAAALDIAARYRPEIALLDLGMPGMDGCELAAALRRSPESKDTVLIAVTGWGQAEDQRRTREAGFAYHMVKPVSPEALQELLQGIDPAAPQAGQTN